MEALERKSKFAVLDTDSIKKVVTDTIKEAFIEFANSGEFGVIFQNAVTSGVRKKVLQDTKAEWIKGDKKASQLLGVDVKTLQYRRKNGYYVEGVVWKKANYKLSRGSILWNKNALLKEMDY